MNAGSGLAVVPVRAGKLVGGALYLHASAVLVADQVVRDRIEWAAIAAERPDWNVAKVQGDAVSLLTYEAFDEAAFPALPAAVRVNLSDGGVARTDYRDRANPPILHRKETLLRADNPRHPAFAALTRLAEEHKLFAEPHRIGTRKAWLERVEAAGLVVQGARLRHRETAPVDVVRHRTAIIRRDLSQPVQMLVSHWIVTESLIKPAWLDWISCLLAGQIQDLADGLLQMSPFDERDIAAITSPDYPDEH